MNLNVVILSGRLTADPRRFAAPDGGDVTTLRLAVNRAKRPGARQAEADFVDVVVVGDLARHTARWLGKGCRIELYGNELSAVRNADPHEVVRCENCGRILVRTAESGL